MTDASQLTSAAYSLGKTRIAQDATLGRASQSYADTLRKQRGLNSRKTMDWNYGRSADNTAFEASSRGFGKKGMTHANAWQNYQQNAGSAYRDFNLGQVADNYASSMNVGEINRAETRGLEDVELSEFERKANLAASLRGYN